jgi:hypothetical protein
MFFSIIILLAGAALPPGHEVDAEEYKHDLLQAAGTASVADIRSIRIYCIHVGP